MQAWTETRTDELGYTYKSLLDGSHKMFWGPVNEMQK